MLESKFNNWPAFVLSIPRNAVKAERTIDHLRANGVAAEPFWGLDAELCGLDHTRWTYEIDHPGSNYRVGPKTIAMHLSHHMLWRAASFLDAEAIWVFEDDARFIDGWRTHWDFALPALPTDWDMLYIGSCCCMDRPRQVISGQLHRIESALCTHAYAVRAKALSLLVEKTAKVWAPVDLALRFDCHPHLNVYGFLPRLVDQEATQLLP